jgi:hypothetical protein
LVPIYSFKKVLIQREVQDYRYTREGGDPDAKEAKETKEEESATETESDPESDPEKMDTSGEWQEQETEPRSGNKTQTREEPTGNLPPEKPEVENQAGSVEKVQEADQSQGLAHSAPGQLAMGQEA